MFGKLSFRRKKNRQDAGISVDQERYHYCPSCGDEYRLEFTFCASCNVELSAETSDRPQSIGNIRKKTNRTTDILPNDELLTVRTGSLVELKSLQAILKAEMIGSLLVSDNAGQRQGCCGPSFSLKIKSVDSEDASAVLVDDFKRSTALECHNYEGPADAVFDDKSTSASCPACGSRFKPGVVLMCPECGLCF
ncbi:MAG: hypothetical protein KJO32_03205 [Deltaproteobacteria bacterium]|nr:hypothetical protein [Deltaproteobacteria bacterium]